VPSVTAPPAAARRGLALCVLAAAGFGAAPIVGGAARDAGLALVPMLAVRFAAAAVLLWALVAWRPGPRPSRRTVLLGLVLGGAFYAPESGLFFAAIDRMDASLTALVVYVYPGLVAVAAVALGRERLSPRRMASLAAASGGVGLVLAGAGAGAVNAAGIALALGSALAYAGYVLVSDLAVRDASPRLLAALVCTGSALAFGATALAGGGGGLDGGGRAWMLLALMVAACTVTPIVAFMAGIRHVGPSTASIAATAEPVVTAGLAMLVAGDRLTSWQWIGAALVVGAVAVLRAPGRRAPAPTPAPLAGPAPAAGS
jgi:drug/metabolite transporter (DMT)-like permease